MRSWAELEKRFLDLEPSLRNARLDHQSGHEGEHWRLAACFDNAARSTFESLSAIAGRKLVDAIPSEELPEDLRDAPTDPVRWYRFLIRDLSFYNHHSVFQIRDGETDKAVGWSSSGSVSNPAAAAAAHCLKMIAMTSEKEDEKPSVIANFYGDNSRLNLRSVDNSNNVVNSADVFAELHKVIQEHVAKERQTEILATLDSLRTAANTPSYAHRYKEFMASVADHITIVPELATVLAPYIPILAVFISR